MASCNIDIGTAPLPHKKKEAHLIVRWASFFVCFCGERYWFTLVFAAYLLDQYESGEDELLALGCKVAP